MTRFRTATLAELRLIVDWAAAEGWNPGLDDAEAFHSADPQGFFVAVDQADAPIAAISIVNHNEAFAFLGLYIVHLEHRGKGIGLELWTHALAHAGSRTVGLDGVEDQQSNYAVSGFRHAGGTTRYSGNVVGVTHESIELTRPEHVSTLIGLEAEASGVEKPAYMRAWFGRTDHRVTLVTHEGGEIRGLCTVRRCRDGAKVGPLIADDADVARRLIDHAATLFEGPLIIDVPDTAKPLIDLSQAYGLTAGFQTARMYRGRPIFGNSDIYAVATLELG